MLLAALAACGDDLDAPPAYAPASGAQLQLERYRYADGTEQTDTSMFYDTKLHAECTPQPWADGTLRCTPAGDEARFTDAACTVAVGLAESPPRRPTSFLGYDLVDGALRPARLYRVNGTTDAFAQYYLQRGDACTGPFPSPFATDYYTLGALEPTDALALTDSELGAGRIGLHIREAADGMHVPIAVWDRELEVACTPAANGDTVACEPNGAVAATEFLDPACHEPAVVAPVLDGAPPAATVVDALGCTRYHAVGDEVDAAVYHRDGDACTRVGFPLASRTFRLGPELALPQLARTVEGGARRLREITLSPVDDPDLRFVGDRLVDTATREECTRVTVDDVTSCLPTSVAPVLTLYRTGCLVPVGVVEVVEPTCTPVAFAAQPSDDGDGLDVFAIGDPVTEPLYDGNTCTVYAPPPGHVVRALGPALPPDAFPTALKFGSRAP